MLTNWISPDALKSLNDGFVVAIMLEAKEGEADALAEILRVMTPPTMAEPGVKLFLSYRSPANPLLFFIFELYVNEAAWGCAGDRPFQTAVARLLPRSRGASACASFRFSPTDRPTRRSSGGGAAKLAYSMNTTRRFLLAKRAERDGA